MTGEAVRLLSVLLVTHFLGDFTPLATRRMLEAKANGGPLGPIALHAAVHGALAGAAVLLASTAGWAVLAGAALVVFGTHFGLDAARARLGDRFAAVRDPRRNLFWTALGLDQLAHGLVLVGIAGWLL